MPTYRITDPNSGMTVRLTGDSPPTEQELVEIFGSVGTQTATPQEQPGLGSRVLSGMGEAWNAATNPEYSMSRKALRTAGALGEVAGDVMMTGAKNIGGILTAPMQPETKATLSGGVQEAAGWLADTDIGRSVRQTFGDVGRAWGGVQQAAPETAKDVEAALQAGNLIPAAAGARVAAPVAKEGVLVAADAAQLAAKGAGQAIGKLVPKGMPEKILESGAKWSTTLTPDARRQLSKIMFDEKISLNPKGYDKLNATVENLNQKISRAVQKYSDVPIDAKKVAKRTDEARAKAERSYDPATETEKVDQEVSRFLENWDGKLTVPQAQSIKQDIYKQLKSHYDSVSKGGPGKYTDGEIAAKKNIARGLKEEIEKVVTDVPIKELNARESALLKLEPHLRRAVGRIENHNIISLDDVLATGVGSVLGAFTGGPMGAAGGAAVAGILKKVLGAPSTKAKIAGTLSKVQRAGQGEFQPSSQTGKAIAETARGDMNEALGVLVPAETPAAVRLVEPPTRPKLVEAQKQAAQQAPERATAAKKPEIMVISGMPFRNADVAMSKMQQYGVNPAEYGPIEVAPGQWVVAKGAKAPQTAKTVAEKRGGDRPSAEADKLALKKIFHGTDKLFDEFDLSKSADGSIWFTDSKKSIEAGEAGAVGKGRIVERFIDENKLKLGGWEEADKYGIDELIAKGYDGLKLPDDGETTYQIFNPGKLLKSSPETTPKAVGGIEVDWKTKKLREYEEGRTGRIDTGDDYRLSSVSKDEMDVYKKSNPQLRTNPKTVTIYRATEGGSIAPGDWVYLRKDLAEKHLESRPDAKVISQKVSIGDVITASDDVEFVYSPKSLPNPSRPPEVGGRLVASAKPKAGATRKGPENLVTYIQAKGGIKFGPTYKGDVLREFPDLKRVSNQKTGLSPDVLAEELNSEGIVSPTGRPFDGDSLIETLKSDQARNVFTPDKADDIIARKLRGPENEWIERQLANLEEKIDAGAVEESSGDIQRGFLDAIRAKGIDPEEDAALKEIGGFFSEISGKTTVKNPLKITVKNTGRAGAPGEGGGVPAEVNELLKRLKKED